MALSQKNGVDLRAELINKYVEYVLKVDIDGLFGAFFGEQAGIALTSLERERLHDIISSAWDWNQILKGSVVVLGDLQPVAYNNGLPFDSLRMSEFEPRKGEKGDPDVAMCTIGLGLVVSRSKVKGSAPDVAVVSKASVVTERRYN